MTVVLQPPFYWRGTPEEWNRVPAGERVLLASKAGSVRDQEAERLLAVARNEHYTPTKTATATKPELKKAPHFVGIRNWTEPVEGISAERIRNCIIFVLDVKKDPWYINNCNNRAFVKRFVHKMDAETPEDFIYDPNAILQTRRRHIDGENQPVIQTFISRHPETDEERKEIRDKYGVSEATIKYLAKKDCPKCHGKAFVDVPDYSEPPFQRLSSSDVCQCVWE